MKRASIGALAAVLVAVTAGCGTIQGWFADHHDEIINVWTNMVPPQVEPVTPPPDTTPDPVVPEEDDSAENETESLPSVEPIHAPVWGIQGATYTEFGYGRAKYNANSSRHTLKMICPGKWAGTIARVYAASRDGKYAEVLYRKTPDESGKRQRYYGKVRVTDLPKEVFVRVDCVVDGKARDYFFIISDTSKNAGG